MSDDIERKLADCEAVSFEELSFSELLDLVNQTNRFMLTRDFAAFNEKQRRRYLRWNTALLKAAKAGNKRWNTEWKAMRALAEVEALRRRASSEPAARRAGEAGAEVGVDNMSAPKSNEA